ncbi:MAG TPA: toll/interleukin-1 receptor domain-containing protein [Blastocatellia bacterium]
MKVFISWSGERSQMLAQAPRDWLPLVLHYVEPWLSEADIAAGERWADAVAKELEASNFGVIRVTQENVGSHWVLFEAGALAKSMQGSKVIPLLLDLEFKEVTGPLAQFQAKKVEKSGLGEVVRSINNAANQPVPEAREKQLFDALWPEFEKSLASLPKHAPAAKHARPQHEILEELVASVRSLDSRFRDLSEELYHQRRPRRSRLNPGMFQELGDRIAETLDDGATSLLVSASFLRDDFPWIYELAADAYRAIRTGAQEEADGSLRRFRDAANVLSHTPFVLEETSVDPRALQMVLRAVPLTVDRLLAERQPRVELGRKKRDDSDSVSFRLPEAK